MIKKKKGAKGAEAKAAEPKAIPPISEAKADKVEAKPESDAGLTDTQARLAAIRSTLGAGSGLSFQDATYLLGLLDRLDAAHMALKDNVEKVRAHAIDSNKQLIQAKDVLTMWLAMRGSADLEVFQATASLAQRSVQILNA